jgi:hypothetical protein
MTITRVPTINELLSISAQSTQGTPATPATADIMTFMNVDLNPDIENIIRADKGLGRSMFGYVAPGKQLAKWTAELYAILANGATPPVAPEFEQVLISAMGASPVVFNDTVQASPTPTTTSFAVGNASTLKVGDPVAVNVGGSIGWQMRPISGIASNTLTFTIPFGAAPPATNVVQARLYRLGSTNEYLTIVDWLRDATLATSALSRMAVDAIANQFTIDCSQTIVRVTAGGPASFVVEKQSPASGIYNGTFPTLPSLPVNLTTGFSPETPYLNGEVFLDTTLITAYTVKMMLDNGAKQLPVPFGSQFADGVILGQRKVALDLEVDGNSANYSYLLDAEQKNPHALFFHTGQTLGQFIGVSSPKMVLGLNDYQKNDVTVRLNFSNSLQFATTADNELTIAIS